MPDRLCIRDDLWLQYLHFTSFAIGTTLARFFVDSARRPECARVQVVVCEGHTETSSKTLVIIKRRVRDNVNENERVRSASRGNDNRERGSERPR
jgi:hypothetical protein